MYSSHSSRGSSPSKFFNCSSYSLENMRMFSWMTDINNWCWQPYRRRSMIASCSSFLESAFKANCSKLMFLPPASGWIFSFALSKSILNSAIHKIQQLAVKSNTEGSTVSLLPAFQWHGHAFQCHCRKELNVNIFETRCQNKRLFFDVSSKWMKNPFFG